jgi:hypothetical protein
VVARVDEPEAALRAGTSGTALSTTAAAPQHGAPRTWGPAGSWPPRRPTCRRRRGSRCCWRRCPPAVTSSCHGQHAALSGGQARHCRHLHHSCQPPAGRLTERMGVVARCLRLASLRGRPWPWPDADMLRLRPWPWPSPAALSALPAPCRCCSWPGCAAVCCCELGARPSLAERSAPELGRPSCGAGAGKGARRVSGGGRAELEAGGGGWGRVGWSGWRLVDSSRLRGACPARCMQAGW